MPLALGAGSSGGGGGVVLTNSADFEESSNEFFSLTPSTGDSIQTWTVAVWLNREEVTTDDAYIFHAVDDLDGDDRSGAMIMADDDFRMQTVTSTAFHRNRTQTGFADSGEWHHWVFVHNTTSGTAANRLRIYRDGSELTLDTEGSGNPPQNFNGWVGSNNLHVIGRHHSASTNQFDGLMADLHYIDGLALTPSDFVTFDGLNFTILEYAGSYGSNGARLRFDNGGDLGEDSSGNNNDWANINTVTQSSSVPTSPVTA